MNDEQIHKRVPVRRFPEFKNDGEWVKSVFSDVLDFLPNNTLSRADLNYDKGAVKNIHYGDVLIKFGETLDVKECRLPFISDEKKAQKACQGALKNGDVVIADTAEDEVVGKCTELKNMTNEIVVSGLHTIPVRPNVFFASSFLGFYLNSESYRNQLKPLMQGIKVIALSKGALSTTKIVYPRNFEEQRKIADCLSSMNDLISVTKNKLELLKNYKKALIKTLFPALGHSLPKFRLNNFAKDAEWKEYSLGEVFDIRNGYTPPKSNPTFWEKGSIPWFRLEDIRLNGRILSDSIQHITPEAIKAKGLFPANSIIISTTATIGEHALIVVDALANQQFTCLTKKTLFNKSLDMLFFYYYMFIVDEWCRENVNSGGLPIVCMQNFKRLKISLPPNINEQKEIAASISFLDVSINALVDKILVLNICKNGLERLLFVR